jgi:hypothetical protein
MRRSFRLAIAIVVGLVASAAIAIAYLAASADSFLYRGLDIMWIRQMILFLFKIAIPPEKPYVCPSRALHRFDSGVPLANWLSLEEGFQAWRIRYGEIDPNGSPFSRFTQVTSMCANIICVHINRRKSSSHEKKDTRFARSRHHFSSLRF